ncbi:hypothetical protein HMN09_00824300 [Mycena chlorophos]|uniref:Uncharacterized protein n=1 Tax=Mycena chlorophos TaxID=658473 RepID=A0A8H6W783_MYCCL|nr:hypothetical protein HMN09_00824300 [Mycena chlorophos]
MAGPTKRDKNNFQNAKNRFFQLLDDAKCVTDTPCMVDTDNLHAAVVPYQLHAEHALEFQMLPRKFTWVQIRATAHLRHKGDCRVNIGDEEDEEEGEETDIAMSDNDRVDGIEDNTEESLMENDILLIKRGRMEAFTAEVGSIATLVSTGTAPEEIKRKLEHLQLEMKATRDRAINPNVSSDADERKRATLDAITWEILASDKEKQAHWEHQRLHAVKGEHVVLNDAPFVHRPMDATVLAALVTTAMASNVYHLPRIGANITLAGFRDVLNTLPGFQRFMNKIPREIDTVANILNLNAATRSYAVCPHSACRGLVLESSLRKDMGAQPPRISFCKVVRLDGVCGQALTKTQTTSTGKIIARPICTVVLQSFADWLGRLLARPGIEERLVRYPASIDPHPMAPSTLTDVWGSPTVRNLRGADNLPFFRREFFHDAPGPELRLLLTLAADGFNPNGNSTAKQTKSSKGFWIAVLNLPPDERFKLMNLFFFGQSSSSHSLSYDPGLFFSRTHDYPNGRSLRAMVGFNVADALGLREMTGASSITSKWFCCNVSRHNIEDLNISSWHPRPAAKLAKYVQEYKDAETLAAREEVRRRTGVRPSDLGLLPYADQLSPSPVEPMHNQDLGLIQQYCRNWWEIDEERDGGDGSAPRAVPPPTLQLETLQADIRLLLDQFNRCRLDYPNDFGSKDEEWWKELLHDKMQGSKADKYRRLWYLCKSLELRTREVPVRQRTFDEVKKFAIPPVSSPGVSEATVLNSALLALQTAFPQVSDAMGREKQQSCLNLLRRVYRSGGVSVPGDFKKDVFILLCRTLKIKDAEGKFFAEKTSATKEDMFNALLADESISTGRHEIQKTKIDAGKGAVLGRNVMEQIKADTEATQLPTWLTRAPKGWGTKAFGKLSAAQWHTLFLVHFPYSIICLWHTDPSARMRKLLRHALRLVEIIQMASLREITHELTLKYRDEYEKWFGDLMELFPDENVTPTFHQGGHIGINLEKLGPAHSRGAQFYEHFIYLIHQVKTNSKPNGQMDGTFLRSLARQANLLALLEHDETVRAVASQAVDAFTKAAEYEQQRDAGHALAASYGLGILFAGSKPVVGLIDPLHNHLVYAQKKKVAAMDVDSEPSYEARRVDKIGNHRLALP